MHDRALANIDSAPLPEIQKALGVPHVSSVPVHAGTSKIAIPIPSESLAESGFSLRDYFKSVMIDRRNYLSIQKIKK